MYYIGIYYSANNSAKRVEDYSRTRKHAFAYYYSDKSLEKREKVSGIKLILSRVKKTEQNAQDVKKIK